MKLAFTICSANYLPFAKALADSVVAANSGYQFVIALADRYRGYDAAFFGPHRIISVEDMQLSFFKEMDARYNIFELSCALKPYVAEYLLHTMDETEMLFYFDSDILVFGSLSLAEDNLRSHPLVLTPHLLSAQPAELSINMELDILRAGTYNGGFFGVNKTAESFAFLTWWKERLRLYCYNNTGNGLFVDQLWLSLAPVYFRGAVVLSHPGYNMAYWNFTERKLTQTGDNYFVNETYPLVFFHYSGYDVQKPEAISKYSPSLLVADDPLHLQLFQQYRTHVAANRPADYFLLPTTVGRPVPVEVPKPVREKNFFKRKWKKLFKKK